MPSVQDIIESYFSLRYVGSSEDIFEKVASLSEERAFDLITDFETNFGATPVTNSDHSYLADARLSGMPVYCAASACRENYLYDLTSFAALYADRVFVANPFSYAKTEAYKVDNGTYGFVDSLSLAIEYALNARPMLENGMIQFSSFEVADYCFDCATKILGIEDPERSLKDKILDHCLRTSEARFITTDGHKSIKIDYDETHGEHTLYQDYYTNDVDHVDGKLLSLDEVRRLRIHDNRIQMTIHDFFVKNIHSHKLGVSNLLSNSPELNLISSITNKPNSPLLDTQHPTLFNRNLEKVLQLRESEWRHLEKYRDMVSEIRAEKNGDLKAIKSELRNQEDQLSRIIAKERDTARNTLSDKAVAGFFGLGGLLMTSGVSNLLAGAAALIGGAHLGKTTIPAFRKSFSEPIEAKENPAYYSWKIKKILD